MKLKQISLTAALVIAGFLSSPSAIAQESVAHVDNNVTFPELNRAWLKNGTFIDVEQLRRIGRGMSANQVRELISYPHFSEGFGLSDWNYIFNFRTGKGEEFITCQYQVQFKDGKSNAMYWKDKQCENFVNPAVPQVHPVTLSGDGLFAFDRSGFNDLQVAGRENLTHLASQIKSSYNTLKGITIVGHTDRFGSPAYNTALSLRRANTVKQFFVSQGLPAALIQIEGAGASRPVVVCPGAKSSQVVACLMPNRRIEVIVKGDL